MFKIVTANGKREEQSDGDDNSEQEEEVTKKGKKERPCMEKQDINKYFRHQTLSYTTTEEGEREKERERERGREVYVKKGIGNDD